MITNCNQDLLSLISGSTHCYWGASERLEHLITWEKDIFEVPVDQGECQVAAIENGLAGQN